MELLSPLITADALAARLDAPDLRLVDASWHLDGRDARAEFDMERLPGAIFFDLDAVSDTSTPLPHMLPSPTQFAEAAGAMGIAADDHVVIYDSVGLFSAARVWWMFRVMGARRVQVLDGGLPVWRTGGRPVAQGPAGKPTPVTFQPDPVAGAVASLAEVRTALAGPEQVVDARGAGRFLGQVPEPRPGLRPGHMPGAINLPFGDLLQADGTLKRGPALESAFRHAGIDLDRPVITSCGSGVTAAILSLGLAVLCRTSRLYDGSWAEWGGRDDTPVETESPS